MCLRPHALIQVLRSFACRKAAMVTSSAKILRSLQVINEKLDVIMSQQDEVNADVAQIQDGITALGAAAAAIQAEIDALKNANPALDLSALDAAAAALSPAVEAISALAPPATP